MKSFSLSVSIRGGNARLLQIGRARVRTPVTSLGRMPSSAWKTKIRQPAGTYAKGSKLEVYIWVVSNHDFRMADEGIGLLTWREALGDVTLEDERYRMVSAAS